MKFMITLPDFDKAFDYENNFYLSCHKTRIGKILTQYELLKRTVDLNTFTRYPVFIS